MIVFLKHKTCIPNIFIAICALTILHRVIAQAMHKPRLTISFGVSQAICTSTANYITSKTIQGPHKDTSKFPTSPKHKCETLQWIKCVSRKRCATFACHRSSSSSEKETRIVGGIDALPHEFPHQTSFFKKPYVYCGGSVLNEKYVLTAAHCFNEPASSSFTLIAGGHSKSKKSGKEQERKLKKIIIHEGYIEGPEINDIALVEVDPPFQLTDAVAPVLLPMLNYSATGDATVTGWGRLRDGGDEPDILQKVTVPIITDAECQDTYRYDGKIFPTNICAGYLGVGGKDSCGGDSGGPLVIKIVNGSYLLVGIVSWGIGCADPYYPGVYTEVSMYIDWIYKNSGIEPEQVPQVTTEMTDCQK